MGQPFLCVQWAHGHHTALWSELTAPRPGELDHHLASAVHPVHYKNDLLPSNRLPTPMHRNPVLSGPGSAQQGAPRSLRLGGMKAGSAVQIAGRLAGSRGLVLNSSEAGQRPVHRPAFVQPQLSSAGAGPVTLTAGREQGGGKRPAALESAAHVLSGLLPLRTLVPVSDRRVPEPRPNELSLPLVRACFSGIPEPYRSLSAAVQRGTLPGAPTEAPNTQRGVGGEAHHDDRAGTCASPPRRPRGALVRAPCLDPPSCESARAV